MTPPAGTSAVSAGEAGPTDAQSGSGTGSGLGQLDPELRVLVVAKAFAALADPIRLRIVEILAERGECSARELVNKLPVSQPRVSVHLRCLTDCGFTTVRREGRRAYYQLAAPHIAALLGAMRTHTDTALPGLLACLHCQPLPPGQGLTCC
ncbi:MAG: ArsR/SmtB family transcription factor [Pseudonocardiaceae bacterium]